MRQAAGD